jgi:hypothetical protein
MKKDYNYFYRTTNLINNKYYFGVHKTNNINDGYLGSGTRLKYAIVKYGVENFKKEILRYFDKYEDALKYESEVVSEELINDSNCYNLVKGGKGGWNNDTYMNVIDKKTNNCIRVLKNSEYYKNTDNYYHLTKNMITVYDISGNTFKVNIDDEKFINREFQSISKNKVTVKDVNNNIYSVDIKDERYVKGELKFIWKDRKHNQESKNKIGIANSIHQKGKKNSQYGTYCIYNDELKRNMRIKKQDIDIWLVNGWKRGINKMYNKKHL